MLFEKKMKNYINHLVSNFVKEFFCQDSPSLLKRMEKLTHILGVDTLAGYRKSMGQFDSPSVTDNIHAGYLTAVSRHSLCFCAFLMLVAAFPTHSAVVIVRIQHQTTKVLTHLQYMPYN